MQRPSEPSPPVRPARVRRQLPPALRARQQKGRPNPNRGKTFPIEVLSERDVAALIEVCPARTRSGVRNRALIALLYRSGLRIAEALALTPKDLDLAVGAITVLHGKGDKRRTVGVDPITVPLIAAWLEVRAEIVLETGRLPHDGDPLFLTIGGRPLSGSGTREMLKRAAHRAGIRKRVHPHGFRHTHAFELSVEGTPLPIIQRQLGHEHLATTEIYLNHFAAPQVIRAIRTRSWTPPDQ